MTRLILFTLSATTVALAGFFALTALLDKTGKNDCNYKDPAAQCAGTKTANTQ